jgi:hypothetical protein
MANPAARMKTPTLATGTYPISTTFETFNNPRNWLGPLRWPG